MDELVHPAEAVTEALNGSGNYCRRCTAPTPGDSIITNVPRLVTCHPPEGVPTCPVCGYVDGHAEACLHPESLDAPPALERADATVTRIHADAAHVSEDARCPECEGKPPYHTRTCPVMVSNHSLRAPDGVDAGEYPDGCAYEHMTALAAALHGRHPASQRFHDLLTLAGEMHDRKQADYGSDTDPFANVRAASEWGMPGWVGAMVRVNDKVRRLQAFARKGTLANESAEDSFLDIAVYALIAHVLYHEESTTEGGQ